LRQRSYSSTGIAPFEGRCLRSLGRSSVVRIVDRPLERLISSQRYATVVGVEHPTVYGLVLTVRTVLLTAAGGM